jgi:glycine cleavage system aminomethyltransferase T
VGGYDLVEAGLAGPVKPGAFIGREALQQQLSKAPAAQLCTLVVEDHTGPGGEARFMVGGEPVTTRDGELLVDAKGRRSFVTSAGSAPSIGRHVLNTYLPPEHARAGAQLAVEYFGERYPVSVLAVGPEPLVSPERPAPSA